jgi:hypothetical protein
MTAKKPTIETFEFPHDCAGKEAKPSVMETRWAK